MRSKGLVDPQLDEEYPLPYSESIPRDSNIKKTGFDDQDYSTPPTLALSPPSPTADVAEFEIDYRIHYSHRMLYLLKKVITLALFSFIYDFVLSFFD